MWSLQNERSVFVNLADKGPAVAVTGRTDYLKEAVKQLKDRKTYKEIRITEKDQVELVERSNKLFPNWRRKNVITESENNYFRFNLEKATYLKQLYLLPKIHTGLCKVPGWPVISNCRTPTEKVSKFLDHHLQPIIKQGKTCVRDTGDFLAKLKAAEESQKNVGLYPSIPHSEGLGILKKQYGKYPNKNGSTKDVGKTVDVCS